MPGHKVAPSTLIDRSSIYKYQCSYCNHLLKDAVRAACGHWLCESCADELLAGGSPKCPKLDCQEYLKSVECFPDRFLRREIEMMIVGCPHQQKGCQWEGRLAKLETHLKACDFISKECNLCGQIESHGIVCHKEMTREEIIQPFQSPSIDSFGEVIGQNVVGGHQSEDPGYQSMLRQTGGSHNMTDVSDLIGGISISMLVKEIERQFNPRKFPISAGLVAIPFEVEGGPSPQDESVQRPRLSALAGVSHISFGPDKSGAMNALRKHDLDKSSESVEHSKAKLQQVEDENNLLRNKVAKLERAMQSKHAEYEDRDFRLSRIENSSYGGSMIWKIPQFSQRMADAQSGRCTSIFSLPFYKGYKMCLRLYCMGDGIGKNTHMSLFFVIMKGELDDILKWPFTSKVTFMLMNQTGNRDIIDSFKPDPISSSFQKPKSDMNLASGCPRFVSHTELSEGGFIVDNILIFKCLVDCNSISH